MTPPFFQLKAGEQFVLMKGCDDHGKRFEVTLDRVWVGNLVQELEEFMSGPKLSERELRRVDL